MKKINLLLLFISFIAFSSYSNEKFKINDIHYKAEEKTPSYIEFNLENAPTLEEFFNFLNKYFKNPQLNSFDLIRSEKDDLGYTHLLYQQHFNGMPIEFAEIRLHLIEEKVKSINGKFSYDLPSKREIFISEKSALESAKNFIGAEKYKWEIEEEENLLKKMF